MLAKIMFNRDYRASADGGQNSAATNGLQMLLLASVEACQPHVF